MMVYNVGYKPWVLKEFSSLLLNNSGYHNLFIFEPAYRRKMHFSERLHLDSEPLSELVSMLENINRELAVPNNELAVTGVFMQITGFICRHQAPEKNSQISDSPGRKMVNYIDENLSEEITLDDLARLSGMSKNGIIAMFRRFYGVTPMKYINGARIYKAEQMLKGTGKSITEIAFETGFEDSNYFSRVFKAYRGQTPGEYRKANK